MATNCVIWRLICSCIHGTSKNGFQVVYNLTFLIADSTLLELEVCVITLVLFRVIGRLTRGSLTIRRRLETAVVDMWGAWILAQRLANSRVNPPNTAGRIYLTRGPLSFSVQLITHMLKVYNSRSLAPHGHVFHNNRKLQSSNNKSRTRQMRQVKVRKRRKYICAASIDIIFAKSVFSRGMKLKFAVTGQLNKNFINTWLFIIYVMAFFMTNILILSPPFRRGPQLDAKMVYIENIRAPHT